MRQTTRQKLKQKLTNLYLVIRGIMYLQSAKASVLAGNGELY